MAETTTVSFRIPTERVEALARLAAVQDRDRSYLLNEAVEQYLDLHEYHAEHIREGMRDAREGRFVDNAEAQAHFDRLIEKARQR